MNKFINKNDNNEIMLYNNIVSLSRNKLFYTRFSLADTFHNRINLIFFHISFIFTKINKKKHDKLYKDFSQNLFDIIFKKIELNMRELGFGDVTVNKNMKYLVKSFYNILLFAEKYNKKEREYKKTFFAEYLKFSINKKVENNDILIKHFDDFRIFCFDLSYDSVLKGEIKFKFN